MKCLNTIKSILKFNFLPPSHAAGFTLIEIIIVIVVLAIVAAMMASFFGSTFLSSTTPFVMIQEQFSGDPTDPGVLESIERIIADYNHSTDKDNFRDTLVPGSANYDADLSATDFSINGITNTGTTLSFTKVVVRKGDQTILAFFPIF